MRQAGFFCVTYSKVKHMAHSSVGIVIVVVIVIILLFVAFGCNGGRWFRQRSGPEAYVALAQKKKADGKKVGDKVDTNSPVAPEPVTLLEKDAPKHTQTHSGASSAASHDKPTHAPYGGSTYQPQTDVPDDKTGGSTRSHLHALPNSNKMSPKCGRTASE